MTRPISRSRREAAFLEKAQHAYSHLEEWYDAHPQASFGELEAEARQQRRALMGTGLELLVNGRDTGFQVVAPKCPHCQQTMDFIDYRPWRLHGLEGESTLERAYYRCPECSGATLFPLDQKLRLRADHWSEGAARVAARQGLHTKSFDKAAEAYSDATGGSMSGDSLRRVTEGFGHAVDARRTLEAQQVYDLHTPQAAQHIVTVSAPIVGQANLSTDGGMVLVRAEGWKEFKISAISAVTVTAGKPTPTGGVAEPSVTLGQHSYQAGLWEAEDMGRHQYLEGTRRRLETCGRLSSVNDGALWIERITTTNYPQALQVLDWAHAKERLATVAQAAFGAGTELAHHWLETQSERLWAGRGAEVVTALKALDWDHIPCSDAMQNSPAYFETRQAKMEYARFRQTGYPIGSGTVESGVNTVVHHRMKRQGRGWSRPHAQAMLAALSELHSGRFLAAWQASLPV